ncbi:signal peptidase I [Bacillus luti]
MKEGETMFPEEKEELRQMRIFLIWSFCFVVLIKTFYITTFEIEGQSMYPSYHDQQRIVAEKVSYRMHEPSYSDVVIVHLTNKQSDNHPFNIIKRVIGKPGDVIEVKNGKVYRNGKALNEPYIKDEMLDEMDPYRIPKNEYFVMGDNRNNSSDSRYYGSFSKDSIIGKVWFSIG